MADSTTNITQISASQSQKETTANELFDAASLAMFGARRADACSGLTWGYYGGRWGGTTVANGTLTLNPSDTNYIVLDRATGDIYLDTASSSDDLWSFPDTYAHLYSVTTGASSVTSYEDHRVGPDGVFLVSPTVTTDTVTSLSSSSGVVDIDCDLGDYFSLTLTENVTSITFSNLPGSGKGATKWVEIIQGSGPYTVAWPASFKWAGGSAGSVSTVDTTVDELAITTVDNGTSWKATLAKAWA